MAKMWTGVTAGVTDPLADDFNSSIRFDKRLYRQDIRGSMAHAAMLSARGILTDAERDALTEGLAGILADLDSGALEIDLGCEDIHMFVEQVLTERIGDVGKKLHTARSRYDQVALDMRLYLKEECGAVSELIRALAGALIGKAEEHKASIMPGYTHLQRAQPVTFGHYLMAYVMMLLRDLDRLADCKKRMDVSPIGCCALAGTTYDTDRRMEAKALGFAEVARNSMDGVSDRDFCVELLGALSILMMHLSRLSEELIRGKTGRVYGDLMGLLTVLKGLPLAYNKDMQEDKEGVFDAIDTVKMCLGVMTPMIETMAVRTDNLLAAAKTGFINATDLADYLTKKGMPFRAAYRLTGQIVAECMAAGRTLEDLTPEEYRRHSPLFGEDLYEAIDLKTCVEKRISEGGTSVASVEKQIAWAKEALKQ